MTTKKNAIFTSPAYFYEDEVYRISKAGELEFGIVSENWEMYSSDEEDDDSVDDPERVPPGHVSISWHPKRKEEVLMESKVKLADRSLMPGDVVRRLVASENEQRGYCRSISVLADVQVVGTKNVIPGVFATELKPVQKFVGESAIYLDSWIGVIRSVNSRITLKYSDSSMCTIDSVPITDNFEDVRKCGSAYEDFFYPGQRIRGQMKYLKEAHWVNKSDELKRTKDNKYVTFTVLLVEPTSLTVQWQWHAPFVPLSNPKDSNLENALRSTCMKNPPPEELKGDDLDKVKCLNLFEGCTVQLGDISLYNPNTKYNTIDKAMWKKQVRKTLINQSSQPKLVTRKTAKLQPKLNSVGSQEDNEEIQRNNTHQIIESASPQLNLDSKEKESNVASAQKKKVTPKVSVRSIRKKKLKKSRSPVQPPSVTESTVIVETVHTQSTASVVWQDGTYEEGISTLDLYPIHHLDDHEFFPGDFVVRSDSVDVRVYGVIQQMDHRGRVAVVKWFEAYSFSGSQSPRELDETEMSVYDLKDHPDFRFRPGTIVIRVANMLSNQYPAGQIMDNYPTGQVRVWWANGVTSFCWPQDLFRLGDYDSDDGEIWGDPLDNSDFDLDGDDGNEENLSDSSWITETEDDSHDASHTHYYERIGKLIQNIQKSLVLTREAMVCYDEHYSESPSKSSLSEADTNKSSSSPGVKDFPLKDQRSFTKRLLLIYKDCQCLDKLMGTNFFDVEDLKKWNKVKEEENTKSNRIMEQICRLFDVPFPLGSSKKRQEKEGKSEDHPDKESSRNNNVDSVPSSVVSEDALKLEESAKSCDDVSHYNHVSFLLELCSIILTKLSEAHAVYEKRYGVKSPHASEERTDLGSKDKDMSLTLGAIEQIAKVASEILGKKFLSRHHRQLNILIANSNLSNLKSSENVSTNNNVPSSSCSVKTEAQTNDTCPKKVECNKSDKESQNCDGQKEPSASTSKAEENSKDVNDETTLRDTVLSAAKAVESINFAVLDKVPDTHRYRLNTCVPQNSKLFMKSVQKEVVLLRDCLPPGIWIRTYEERMDLFSAMIFGPENTPYEDGLFLFDIHLPSNYPSGPPLVHYVSFCPDRLNPNLYEEGKVCVSLLGTWSGKGSETWTASSSLLQVLISIQGLILVKEPYYNEAGYERQRGTQEGSENSRMYNEMVLIKLVQSMSRILNNPHAPWEKEIFEHISNAKDRMCSRLEMWSAINDKSALENCTCKPGFSLLPASKGFSITLQKTLNSFSKTCDAKLSQSKDPCVVPEK